ncbi:MAG: SpoIID/LytB domain-containing protein [Candidatus Marinimicrobia bacterium]|nr:SpoIID/LytB domain-containing protein [Candidatus Neomarinimicrobiota bacterium]
MFNDAGKKVLLRGDDALSVKIEEDMLILADRRDGGKVLLRGASLRLENTAPDGNIEIKQVPFGNGWWWSGEKDRRYQGNLEFYINRNNHLDVINVLNIEKYLYGVVPAEIGTDAPLEALKAQAVCARSEAPDRACDREIRRGAS